KAYDAFINDINQHGGILNRMIKPVYRTVCPLNPNEALTACTAFADDDNVFAVLGDFGDPNGAAPLCMTKTKKRVLLTYELTQDLIDKAPKGLLLTPDILPDRKVKVVMSLLASQHTLDGKTVAVLGDTEANDRIAKVIEPALGKMNVKRGSTGIITVTSTDTTAAQAQLDGFIEKWRTEGVDALILAGAAVESRPFVDKVRQAFPNITLVSDSTDVLEGGQAEVRAHVTPNAFAGIITAEGRTGLEHTQTQHFTTCKTIFEAQTHITVPSPNDVIKLPDGRQNNIYGEEEDACVFVKMFETIATKVGPDLNNANWTATVDNFGKIDIMSTDFASLHAGKYDADNTYGLVAFDPTIPKSGDWKRVTPVLDVSGD
ncbi:MAG TPA: ABC transporter substrate-binding protein, partial [Acidimicrobiia bacterium]|nr:ABC transporter substrate-binding protein [Acidimicrobiia bacterium]